MIRKFLMIGFFVIIASFCMTYVTFPRCGGDALAGSLAGSFIGTTVASSMAQPRSCERVTVTSSDDGRALRAVDRLEDVMRRDIQTLNDKITKLEKKIDKLESQNRKEKYARAPEKEEVVPAAKNIARK